MVPQTFHIIILNCVIKENLGDYYSLMKYSIETIKQNKKLTGPIVLHDKLISTKVLLVAKTL